MQNSNVAIYNKMRNDFFAKFHKIIIPEISRFENERKMMLFLAIFISLILLIIGTAFVIFIMTGKMGIDEQKFMAKIPCFIYAIAIAIPLFIKKIFEQRLKDKVMPVVCGCFEKLKWNCNMYFESGVLRRFTGESYDDMFKGSYKDVAFDIVECSLYRGTRKQKTNIFSGVIVVLNMNKNFTCHTVIKPNTIEKQSPLKKLRHTELEDIEFNKKFDVYTNDEVEARYLITPSFMERLKNIKTVFTASKVSCAFYEKQLVVALSTSQDLFSIGSLIKPVTDEKQFTKMFEEILSIIKLIDHFKLNEKTGL